MEFSERLMQRWSNLGNAYAAFLDAVKQSTESPDNLVIRAGLIQTYEFTFELSWKLMKDYLILQGFDLSFPRDVLRKAYGVGLITDGKNWLQALDDRNRTAHAYDGQMAKLVGDKIIQVYYPMIQIFYEQFASRIKD